MQLLAWYDQNKRPLPWRLDQASLRDPYKTWVSEVMLQQTLIPVVIPAYQRFLEKFPDVFALSHATEDELRPLVRTDPLAPYASAIGKLAQSEARELTQRARMRPLGADVEARLGGLAEHP